MKILIFGAGSVGQLYGFCLQQGGAYVDVYVRQEYADDARKGYTLYERRLGFQTPLLFRPEEVLTSFEELARRNYDAAFLCIPSNELRKPWFPEFSRALGDALLISLTPGLTDKAFIHEHRPPNQIATGLITSVSYPAPLDGEDAPRPGTAFWFPPLTPALFEGPTRALSPVLQHLHRGGMTSREVSDLGTRAGFASGILSPFIAGLESEGWSFDRLKKSRHTRQLIVAAIREVHELLAALLNTPRPATARLISAITLSASMTVAPRVPPFDLEVYFHRHFTKVGAQMRQFLDDYIRLRADRDLPSPALSELQTRRG